MVHSVMCCIEEREATQHRLRERMSHMRVLYRCLLELGAVAPPHTGLEFNLGHDIINYIVIHSHSWARLNGSPQP